MTALTRPNVRKHITFDESTLKALESFKSRCGWTYSGCVRVAVISLYARELAPLDLSKLKLGRPQRQWA